jgi:hypothetical protein
MNEGPYLKQKYKVVAIIICIKITNKSLLRPASEEKEKY